MQTHELLQFCEVSRGDWHGKCCRLIGRAQELSTDQIAIRRALATCAVPHDAMRVAAVMGIDGRVARSITRHSANPDICFRRSHERLSLTVFFQIVLFK